MKSIIAAILLTFSTLTFADVMVKTQYINTNVEITFTDFKEVADDNNVIANFDKYECIIEINNWVYEVTAYPVKVDGDIMFRCLDQGYLQLGQRYPFWIKHTEWISEFQSSSPFFWLDVK